MASEKGRCKDAYENNINKRGSIMKNNFNFYGYLTNQIKQAEPDLSGFKIGLSYSGINMRKNFKSNEELKTFVERLGFKYERGAVWKE